MKYELKKVELTRPLPIGNLNTNNTSLHNNDDEVNILTSTNVLYFERIYTVQWTPLGQI